jgi:hypothetical protein
VCVSFVTSRFRLSVCNASFFQISLRDLCTSLLVARLTSATKFAYFENGYHESSSRGAPLRTVALHAMFDTVHRPLINRYTHSTYVILIVSVNSGFSPIPCPLLFLVQPLLTYTFRTIIYVCTVRQLTANNSCPPPALITIAYINHRGSS